MRPLINDEPCRCRACRPNRIEPESIPMQDVIDRAYRQAREERDTELGRSHR